MSFGNARTIGDLLLVNMSDGKATTVPVGTRRAMIGMKQGERRRIQCPVALGFVVSDWNS